MFISNSTYIWLQPSGISKYGQRQIYTVKGILPAYSVEKTKRVWDDKTKALYDYKIKIVNIENKAYNLGIDQLYETKEQKYYIITNKGNYSAYFIKNKCTLEIKEQEQYGNT